MAIFKPLVLVLFTNFGRKSHWASPGRSTPFFLSNELLVNVLTCIKVTADTPCGTDERDGSGRVRDAAGADACGVASVGEGICLSVVIGTGIRHEECGSARCACNLGRRHS